MNRPTRFLALLAVPLALLAVGAFYFLRTGPTPLPDRDAREGASSAAGSNVAPESAEALFAARASDLTGASAETFGQPPPRYRAALGGFTGRMLEPDSTPARKLPVSALSFSVSRFLIEPAAMLDEKHAPPPLEAARCVTDDEGRFLLSDLEPHALFLLGVDVGGPRATVRVIDRTPISGEVVDLGDIQLEPFVTFIGRVLDEDAAPVPGARVRATNLPALVLQFGVEEIRRGCAVMVDLNTTPNDASKSSPKTFEIPAIVWEFEKLLPIPTTVTDDEGRFKLEGIPLGMVSVVADKAGYKAVVKTSPSGKNPERDVRDLYLGAGFTLGGIVVKGSDEPVAGIEVLAGIRVPAVPVPAALLFPAGKSNERGEFSLSGLASGQEAYVATRSSRGQPWTVHGPLAAQESGLVIQLTPPSGFTVRLRDDQGKALESAELFIAPDPLEGSGLLPPVLAPPMQRLLEVAPIEPGWQRVTGLAPGQYELIGRAKGYALATTKIEVAEPPRDYELLFAQAYALDVKVISALEREPLEWAFASLAPDGMFERPIARGRTDPDGKLRLTQIPAGKYRLTIEHPAQATQSLEVEMPSAPVEVALLIGGHLKGRVHRGTEPPGQSLFVILAPKDEEIDDPQSALPTFSATTETGDFFVPNLRVGKYSIEIRDRIVGKGPFALFATMQDDPLARADVEIVENETSTIDLDLMGLNAAQGAELFGSVFLNGAPLAQANVRVEGPRNRTEPTDDQGNFRFEILPPGEFTLKVQGVKVGDLFGLASSVYQEEFELKAGESRRLDLALEVAAVRGRVTSPGQLTVGFGAFAILRAAEGGADQMTTANPLTGTFEFVQVARGEYDLLVRSNGASPWSERIQVEPSRGDLFVDVALAPPIQVSGTIVLPADDPGLEPNADDNAGGAGTMLMLVDENGTPSGRGTINWKTLEFEVREASAGEFHAQLLRREKPLVTEKFEIPRAGASDLVLTFAPPNDDTPLVRPSFSGRGGRRRRGASGN